jgi:hypothetical protein
VQDVQVHQGRLQAHQRHLEALVDEERLKAQELALELESVKKVTSNNEVELLQDRIKAMIDEANERDAQLEKNAALIAELRQMLELEATQKEHVLDRLQSDTRYFKHLVGTEHQENDGLRAQFGAMTRLIRNAEKAEHAALQHATELEGELIQAQDDSQRQRYCLFSHHRAQRLRSCSRAMAHACTPAHVPFHPHTALPTGGHRRHRTLPSPAAFRCVSSCAAAAWHRRG